MSAERCEETVDYAELSQDSSYSYLGFRQTRKSALSYLLSVLGGETQKRKEVDEKMLLKKHRESLRWLKVFLEVAGEIDYNVDFYAAQFESVLGQKIGILTKIQEKVRLFRSALCKEEQGSNQSCMKRSCMP